MPEHWEDGDYYEKESDEESEEIDWDYLYEMERDMKLEEEGENGI